MFLNAYPCRPPRGSLSPEPPMNHGITIADSEGDTDPTCWLFLGGREKGDDGGDGWSGSCT